ncbi:MAG: mannose-1-phosphate guanylyltransferase/mannose-6-phosphate isomerase [Beijerinckiaceae bacterium]
MSSKLLPFIMCGGAGSRLWPLSRESMPKQFLPIIGARSSFEETAAMLASDPMFEAPVALANRDYRFIVGEQMTAAGGAGDIVLEPVRRDSALAVAIAAEIAFRRDPATVVAILAADHTVRDRKAFIELCSRAARSASSGAIVTLGILPDHPATGYGYILPGEALDSDARKVVAFVEKPDAETAARYVEQRYLWNSGNFYFRADVMRAEIEAFEPEIARAAADAVDGARRDLDFLLLDEAAFARAPKKSIDYAVMERTTRAAVIPADIGWSDIGSWGAVHALSPLDEQGNSVHGECVVIGAEDVFVRSENALTAVVGVSGVAVVNTGDAVLVAAADRPELVKQAVEALASKGRREVAEHRRIFRPWGWYQSVDAGPRHQVKRIFVKPGAALSLQKHYHRAEHWIVVRGAAEVTRGDQTTLIHENESIYLPIGCVHRLVNPGKIDLELIEVQTGSYLGEDDIVRLSDVYNRL